MCLQCGKIFTYQRDLTLHSHIHSELILRCSECGKTFADKINFLNHLRIHTVGRLFNCDRCKTKFPFKSHLEIHMKSHADQRTYLCSLCGKDFKWLGNLKLHQKRHAGVNACVRASHLKEIHPGEKTDKDSNIATPLTTSETSKTEGVHPGEKLYSCASCGMNFSTKIYLLAHEKRHRPK